LPFPVALWAKALSGSRPVIVRLPADHGESIGERAFRYAMRFLLDFLV
jgi:hypothetical protein